MYILIDLSATREIARLQDAHDFQSFKVVVRGQGGRQNLSTALAPIGYLDEGGDAYLRIDAVRDLAQGIAAAAEWNASFDTMVAYADKRGWVREGRLQAHCEFVSEEGHG